MFSVIDAVEQVLKKKLRVVQFLYCLLLHCAWKSSCYLKEMTPTSNNGEMCMPGRPGLHHQRQPCVPDMTTCESGLVLKIPM